MLSGCVSLRLRAGKQFLFGLQRLIRNFDLVAKFIQLLLIVCCGVLMAAKNSASFCGQTYGVTKRLLDQQSF